jgi:hypothetical protein
MAASTDVTFWAYNWYIMNNPNKDTYTKKDIVDMARKFAATNSAEVTSGTDPGGTYTDIEWPGANGVTAVGNSTTHTDPTVLGATKTGIIDWAFVNPASKVTLDQATYPETLIAGV